VPFYSARAQFTEMVHCHHCVELQWTIPAVLGCYVDLLGMRASILIYLVLWDYPIAYKFLWPNLIYLCALPVVDDYFISDQW
jgi:hypothetical protein